MNGSIDDARREGELSCASESIQQKESEVSGRLWLDSLTTNVVIEPTPLETSALERRILKRDMLEEYKFEKGVRRVRRTTFDELVWEDSKGSKMVHLDSGKIRKSRKSQKKEKINKFISQI